MSAIRSIRGSTRYGGDDMTSTTDHCGECSVMRLDWRFLFRGCCLVLSGPRARQPCRNATGNNDVRGPWLRLIYHALHGLILHHHRGLGCSLVLFQDDSHRRFAEWTVTVIVMETT
jgi:hypothetical protein